MNLIFTNPTILYLAPFIAAPLILHLISRGKPIHRIFPSIRFIKLGKVPSNEKKKLTDILLLLIRTLILVLLLVFFAGLTEKAAPQTYNSQCAIIVDTSISAYHKDYFSYITKHIKPFLEKQNTNTDFLFITSSNKVVAAQHYKNKSDILTAINTLKPTLLSPNHRDALQTAAQFLQPENSTLIFCSLMDISGLEQINSIKIPESTEIICITPEMAKNNINILGAQFTEDKTNDATFRISVKLINEGNDVQNGEITLSYADKKDKQLYRLQPNQVATLIFHSNIPPNTEAVIRLEQNDDYQPDNVYYCISPKESIAEILLLQDMNKSSVESLFLEEVFKISGTNMIQTRFNKTSVTEFNAKDFKKPDFLILPGSAALLSSAQLTTIMEWHRTGMHLIITPSEEYRKEFSALASIGLITQIAMNKVGSQFVSSPVFFNEVNEKSSYTSLFVKNTSNPFQSIPIHQYIKINHSKNAEWLLTTEDNDPIIVINRTGTGICFLFTIALDSSWSDLPLTSIFLPLMRQIINVSIQENFKTTEEHITPTIQIPLPPKTKSYLQNDKEILLPPNTELTFLSPETDGVYRVEEKTYIVNSARKHSKPDILSTFEFQSKITTDQTTQNTNAIKNSAADHSMRNFILYTILFLFFLEILLHSTIGGRHKERLAST